MSGVTVLRLDPCLHYRIRWEEYLVSGCVRIEAVLPFLFLSVGDAEEHMTRSFRERQEEAFAFFVFSSFFFFLFFPSLSSYSIKESHGHCPFPSEMRYRT